MGSGERKTDSQHFCREREEEIERNALRQTSRNAILIAGIHADFPEGKAQTSSSPLPLPYPIPPTLVLTHSLAHSPPAPCSSSLQPFTPIPQSKCNTGYSSLATPVTAIGAHSKMFSSYSLFIPKYTDSYT
jgi:hypothetical protein